MYPQKGRMKMDRRIERTKKAIQEAYFGLLLAEKPGRITISEVARRANIDRKTFYLHYDSPEDILREFARERVEEIITKVRQEDLNHLHTSVPRIFEMLNKLVEDNLPFFRFIVRHKEYDFFFDSIKDLLVNEIVTNYQGFFGYPEEELSVYAEFYIAGIISVYRKWIREEQALPRKKLASLVGRMTYGGLQTLLADRMAENESKTVRQ